MSIDNLAEMFSQKSDVQQSMGNSIMSAIIGFMAQKMIGQGLGNSTSPFSRSPFDVQVEMVRLNGTTGHTHTITNFVLTTMSQPQ
jgi:hypothetical protein